MRRTNVAPINASSRRKNCPPSSGSNKIGRNVKRRSAHVSGSAPVARLDRTSFFVLCDARAPRYTAVSCFPVRSVLKMRNVRKLRANVDGGRAQSCAPILFGQQGVNNERGRTQSGCGRCACAPRPPSAVSILIGRRRSHTRARHLVRARETTNTDALPRPRRAPRPLRPPTSVYVARTHTGPLCTLVRRIVRWRTRVWRETTHCVFEDRSIADDSCQLVNRRSLFPLLRYFAISPFRPFGTCLPSAFDRCESRLSPVRFFLLERACLRIVSFVSPMSVCYVTDATR